mmetsp:Transcript_4069/g.6423  ORF Transcript_4069/g.6423 Transcript_4069/m.6423 type:complete len:80 (-) Transcript_4069:138-377(-)
MLRSPLAALGCPASGKRRSYWVTDVGLAAAAAAALGFTHFAGLYRPCLSRLLKSPSTLILPTTGLEGLKANQESRFKAN